MTPRWRLKTNSNKLLVLVMLIQVAEWTGGEKVELSRKLNNLDINNETFHAYLNQWNDTNEVPEESSPVSPLVTVVPVVASPEFSNAEYTEMANVLFQASTNDTRMILTDLSRCLYDHKLMICLKMLLLNRVNNMLYLLEKNNLTRTDFYLLDGYVAFKMTNETKKETAEEAEDKEEDVSLDKELADKILALFTNRSLQVTLLPGFGVEIAPLPRKKGADFVCFSTRTFVDPAFNQSGAVSEMRKQANSKNKKKKDKGGFSMMPMMVIPQMIMMGFMPFALANLKAMVMNAFMVNSMALNGAIWMTVRNLIFGPKGGPRIKYVNYGYSKDRPKTKRPEIVLHSPAHFIKPGFSNKKHPQRTEYAPESIEETSETYASYEEQQPQYESSFEYNGLDDNHDAYGQYSNNNIRTGIPPQRRNSNRRKIVMGKRNKNRIKNTLWKHQYPVKTTSKPYRESFEEEEAIPRQPINSFVYPHVFRTSTSTGKPATTPFAPIPTRQANPGWVANPTWSASPVWPTKATWSASPTWATYPTHKASVPDVAEFNIDILKLMPAMKNRFHHTTTERYQSNYIDRVFNTQSEEVGTGQNVGADYRNVFSSKYNKEVINYEKAKSENKHKNHNYSRS